MAKEEIIFDFQIEQGGAIAELEKTKKAIIGLKEEQSSLNKAYKEGNISVEEYASETVRVEQTQKKLTKTYGDLTHQVQGTKSMTDQLKGSMQQLSPALSSSIDGLKGMTTAALKFIATPIGAIIAAIVLVIASLAQYFKRTEEGGDLLAKKMDQLGAIFNVIMDRVAALGGALIKLFSGDFIGAAEAAKKAVSGVTEEIEREYEAAGRLSEILDQLEDRERNYGVAASETTLEIKRLTIEAKNRNLTEEQKIELLKRAGDLEKQQNQELLGIRQTALQAEIDKIQMTEEGAKMTQLAGETAIEFAKRIVENDKIQGDARDELAEKIKSFNEAQGESLLVQEKISNLIDAQREKQQAKVEEEIELESKRVEALAEIRLSEQDSILESMEAFREALLEDYEEKDALKQTFADIDAEREEEVAQHSGDIEEQLSARKQFVLRQTAALRSQLMKQGLTEEQATAKIHRIVEDQKLAATSDALGSAAGILKQHTVGYKVLATAQATIDTYLSASKALANAPNPIIGGVMAAIAVVIGLLNVAKINGVALAGGGKFITKGPTMLLVGDNPGGRERVEVTPLSGRGVSRTFGGGRGIALAGGGTATIDGSIMAASSTRNIDTQFALQDQLANMPPVVLDYSEFTQFTSKVQFKEQLTTV